MFCEIDAFCMTDPSRACLQVCKEAEITEIAIDSREQTQSVYLVKGSEGPCKSDKKKEPAADA